MSQTVTELVDGVDGVRGGVAASVGQQYATVAALSEASPDDLTAIKGVGAVLAERILASARTAMIADHAPADETTLRPVVERLATLVGTTLGWGIRVARSLVQPARHLLHRG